MKTIDSKWYDFPNRNKLFWILQGLGWCFIPVMAAGLLRAHSQLFMPVVVFRAAFGFGVTSFLLRPLLQWIRRQYKLPVAWGIPVMLVIVAVLGAVDSTVISLGLSRLLSTGVQSDTRQLFLESGFVFRTMIYAFWISLYFGINYFLVTNGSRLRLVMLECEKRESELRLLRAQVNPHFLFNGLSSIIAQAEHPERVIEVTHALADFLRFSLTQDGNLHPLGEEFDALENYLQVEKVRFERRLEYTLAADAEARLQPVPYALMQPLLENAMKYGMLTSPPPLRVSLRARLADGQFVLEVENTGRWVAAGSGNSTGIGLANLRRRLELLYGSSATVESVLTPASVIMRVTLPLTPPVLT